MSEETVSGRLDTYSAGVPASGDPGEMQDGREIDLIEVTVELWRERRTVLQFVLWSAAFTAVLVFFIMKPMYTAEAAFLPPQSSPGSSMAQMASQFSSLGAASVFGGLKSPGDVYLGILGSRTIADSLIDKFDLQKVYQLKRISDTEKKLKQRSTFVYGKDTLIAVRVEDHDPQRATDLANAYMDALREQNGLLALTDASQRRLFFQEQLEREKNALADAEVDLKKTQEQTGLIAPSGQAQVEIEAIAQLRAQITSRQVELSSIRQGATDQNPEVVRLQTQISDLELQLQKLQNDNGERQPGSVQLPTARVPELALEYVRKQREVRYHEILFDSIAKQFEVARLDESREAPMLQVIDRAVVPDKKSGPPRALFLIGACVLGAFAGCAWIMLRGVLGSLWATLAKRASL